MKRALLCSAGLVLVTIAFGQAPSSQSLLQSASKEAKKDNKQVMVIFHASWCGWCKRLDAFMSRPDIKPIFDKYVVVTHLDVLENGPQKSLENAGGEELLNKAGAQQAGIPFTLMFDADGHQLADSFYSDKGKKANIGYPAEPQEIAAFMSMLRKSIPNMSSDDAAVLQTQIADAAKSIAH
jgi:thiol-disulfide isomerase/thioredoxin